MQVVLSDGSTFQVPSAVRMVSKTLQLERDPHNHPVYLVRAQRHHLAVFLLLCCTLSRCMFYSIRTSLFLSHEFLSFCSRVCARWTIFSRRRDAGQQ